MEIFELIPAVLPLIQYPAMLMTCVGYSFLTSQSSRKRKIGFTISATGNIVWTIYGVITAQWAIIGTNLYIFANGVIGYLNNSNKKEKKE